MKTFRTTSGPFSERPFYRLDEIERICLEELQSADLYPAAPGPIRVDRFIEKRFNVVPSYEALGDGILGYTKFGRNGVEAIVIAQALDAGGTVAAERRLRTTLAHEAGHGLLHMHLFLETGQATLFDESKKETPTVLCRDEPDSARPSQYRGQWSEFQANRCIGGLLMPRKLALEAADEFTTKSGALGQRSLNESLRQAAVRRLADVFDVNPVVVGIRLTELFSKEGSVQQSF